MEYPEFMMRVKLPSSSAFHSGPSGDTEYEEAFRGALFKVLPQGFEVTYPRGNEKWPMDSEGYSWVRLRCTDNKIALAHWIETARLLEKELRRIKKAVSDIPVGLGV